LLDWGKTNMIAVALHQKTYLWNADNKMCSKIEIDAPRPDSYYVSALSWEPQGGDLLVIANSDGQLQVWGPIVDTSPTVTDSYRYGGP
jgi:hypothetical protein